MSISSLILNSVNEKSEIKIKLTPKEINIIKMLTPELLDEVETTFLEIIKDDKIDSKDISKLIIIIKQIYKCINNLKNNRIKKDEMAATFLKYIIHLLVVNDKVKVKKEKQEDFLEQTDLLVDSCISLLSFTKMIKN